MICSECQENSTEKMVCTNCGLVFEEINIKTNLLPRKHPRKNKKEPYGGSLIGDLSPDIEYTHQYAKHSSIENLDRALGRQKQERQKTEKNFYFRDFKDIQRICDYLQLPKTIINEALNIRKQIGKNSDYFNRKGYYKNMACVKIAAKIHDFPVNEREFIQLTKGFPLIKKGTIVRLRGNETKKEIDKRYREIIYNYLKISIPPKKRPNFITYACNYLNIQHYEENIYLIYGVLQKFLNPSWSIKGVILALIHSMYGKENKIRIIDLENLFNINRLTISSRKKDLKKIMEMIDYGTPTR